jgi:alpha-D-ribose 1-methylphosphonate 5-triphosphate synthase subunit PhnL
MSPRLEVDGLQKAFTLHVLRGKHIPAFGPVRFALAPGECVQLVGPSGSGKSSLLKCLYRTYRPSAGRALLRVNGDTVDLAAAGEPAMLRLRRDTIGYVSQFFQAIPRLTALSVVAEPLLEIGVEPTEARRWAQAMLERLEIPESLWEAYPSTFSGGERQRVNLARALIVPRPLLLLDEPVASLDLGRRTLVLALLQELKAAGASLLAVFHEAERLHLVDRVLPIGGP